MTTQSLNPDIQYVGPGPAGCRCGECGNLGAVRVATRPRHGDTETRGRGEDATAVAASPRHPIAASQTLYYCTLSGQAKRVTWPACANFVAVPDPAGGAS